jgi:DNA-binding transcriptional ArsR family regulator
MTAPINNLDAELFAFYCKALANPLRIEIIRYLQTVEFSTCGDIVDRLPISQATTSQHLKVLKEAGLIRAVSSGTKTLFSLNKNGFDFFKKNVSNF